MSTVFCDTLEEFVIFNQKHVKIRKNFLKPSSKRSSYSQNQFGLKVQRPLVISHYSHGLEQIGRVGRAGATIVLLADLTKRPRRVTARDTRGARSSSTKSVRGGHRRTSGDDNPSRWNWVRQSSGSRSISARRVVECNVMIPNTFIADERKLTGVAWKVKSQPL